MKMNPIEIEAARLFTAEVKSIVRQTYPNNPLNPIGSHSTGLADRLSDFDFTLSFPDLEKSPLERGPSSTRPSSRKAGNKALRSIFQSLQESRRYEGIKLIHARVPIVKAIHRKSQLRVELQTLSSKEANQEYTLYFLAEFPTLRPLYVLFRSALHLRQLNIVFEGGLGSYSVLIMIVNALKHASGQYAQDDLVGHFLHVLDFYSTADLYKHGFSPDPPRIFPKNRDKISRAEKEDQSSDPMLRGLKIMKTYDAKKPYMLCLQDPANAINDLGCRAYGIKHVQKLFEVIRKGLLTNMKAWDGEGDFEKPWHARGLLAPFLAANYKSLSKKRRLIAQWVSEEHLAHRNESSNINAQESHNVDSTEQEVNTNLSPLINKPSAKKSSYVITESTSGELRIDTSDISEETDKNIETRQIPTKIASRSNAAYILGREDSRGQSIDQALSIQHRKVKSDARKKWAPQKKLAALHRNQHQNPKARTSEYTKASEDSPFLIVTRPSSKGIVKHFVPTRGDRNSRERRKS